MSKKIDITNSINTIDDAGLNTAAEVRSVLDVLKDNAYGTVITETDLTVNTITAKNSINTSLKYTVNILKQGRLVTIKGIVINTSASIVGTGSNDFFFEIVGSEYLPNITGENTIFITFNGSHVIFDSDTRTKLYCSSLGANQSRSFNLFYYTQD